VETGFVNDLQGSGQQLLVDQAMLVRGYDPRVRFVAGREAIMHGDSDTAMELWESVFHSNRYFRMNILQMTARQVPVEFFLQQFEPDAAELEDLLEIYTAIKRDRDTAILLRTLCDAIPLAAEQMEDEDERLAQLMKAYGYARRLTDLELAVRIAKSTADEFPLAFEPRYHLGMTLVELERPEEALEHLQWCHEQDPGNIWIPKLIVRARRQMLEPSDESPQRLTRLGT
jgi:tetratricopeptide (TPR) repeat protein